MPENPQIGTPGAHFADLWAQCLKMLKSELLEPILGPLPENAQIGASGTHFVEF